MIAFNLSSVLYRQHFQYILIQNAKVILSVISSFEFCFSHTAIYCFSINISF